MAWFQATCLWLLPSWTKCSNTGADVGISGKDCALSGELDNHLLGYSRLKGPLN